ncbi:MAG: molybdenum cofactor carrier protein [bacterium]|nr:MAG: molybdenum cofactor carrier protein [bacterium]
MIPLQVRLPIVGVMGSGNEPHTERAERLGVWLAELGVHLLTGGGGGVMTSVSRAYHLVSPRKGLVIGIIPADPGETGGQSHEGYPNPWVEVPIFTHLPLRGDRGTEPMSRNHINVLSSDVIVALPGSAGTASEVALALHYGRPLIAYLDNREQIPGLLDEIPVESELERIKEFVRTFLRDRDL